MNFLGHTYEVWAAVVVAVLVRLRSAQRHTPLNSLVTVVVALGSGILLYDDFVNLFSLSSGWEIPMAILIALTAENIMNVLIDLSGDRSLFKNILTGYFGGGADKTKDEEGDKKE